MKVLIKTSPPIKMDAKFVQASVYLHQRFEAYANGADIIELCPIADCTYGDLVLLREFLELDESEHHNWFMRFMKTNNFQDKAYLTSHLCSVADSYMIEAFTTPAAKWITKNIINTDEYYHIDEFFPDPEPIPEAELAKLREKNKWIFYED